MYQNVFHLNIDCDIDRDVNIKVREHNVEIYEIFGNNFFDKHFNNLLISENKIIDVTNC